MTEVDSRYTPCGYPYITVVGSDGFPDPNYVKCGIKFSEIVPDLYLMSRKICFPIALTVTVFSTALCAFKLWSSRKEHFWSPKIIFAKPLAKNALEIVLGQSCMVIVNYDPWIASDMFSYFGKIMLFTAVYLVTSFAIRYASLFQKILNDHAKLFGAESNEKFFERFYFSCRIVIILICIGFVPALMDPVVTRVFILLYCLVHGGACFAMLVNAVLIARAIFKNDESIKQFSPGARVKQSGSKKDPTSTRKLLLFTLSTSGFGLLFSISLASLFGATLYNVVATRDFVKGLFYFWIASQILANISVIGFLASFVRSNMVGNAPTNRDVQET